MPPGSIAGSTAGDFLILSEPWRTITASGSYAKTREIKIGFAGVLRVVFWLAEEGVTGTSFAKIYVNGSPVGTERSSTVAGYVKYTEDISSLVAGDLVQIYQKESLATTPAVKGFGIGVASPHFAGSNQTLAGIV